VAAGQNKINGSWAGPKEIKKQGKEKKERERGN